MFSQCTSDVQCQFFLPQDLSVVKEVLKTHCCFLHTTSLLSELYAISIVSVLKTLGGCQPLDWLLCVCITGFCLFICFILSCVCNSFYNVSDCSQESILVSCLTFKATTFTL